MRRAPREPPLLEEAVAEALVEANGNVTAAAELLEVRSDRLRAYVKGKPTLKAICEEALERGVDLSVKVLFEGLEKEAWTLKLAAAKEFLRSEAATRRGFRAGQGQNVEIRPTGGGTLMLRWLDDDDGPQGPLIEGSAA